jgi:hypothetical protein
MQYHRIRSNGAKLGPLVLLGLGLGVAAGFLLGELYAGRGVGAIRRAMLPWRRGATLDRNLTEITDALEQTLETTLGADSTSLELVPVGQHAIELHGWVTSRAARAKALRVARKALGPETRLIDALLVWGEDDATAPAPEEVAAPSAAEEAMS